MGQWQRAGALQHARRIGLGMMSVYISLGSNLGDSVFTLERAFVELQKLSVRPIQKSSLWRSTPVDCPPGSPDFVTAATSLEPLQEETPESLIVKLQALED